MVASRRASIVFPAPGEPTSSALCPPAAATSSARLACACPRISAKSAVGAGGDSPVVPLGSREPGLQLPRKNPTTSASDGAPITSRSSTSAASVAFAAGTITPSNPARLAAIATESTPGVDTSEPLSDSSPANAYRASRGAGTCAEAGKYSIATGRSSPGPSLRRLPGERFTTTRRSGHSSPALSTAGRIRSRASCTGAPGRPVSVSEGNPRPMCASTTTG